MSSADLVQLLEAVHDRATFLTFVTALAHDRRVAIEMAAHPPTNPQGPAPTSWENGSIEDFLEAASAWAEDIQHTGDERAEWFPEEPSWKAVATFLYMGKIYE